MKYIILVAFCLILIYGFNSSQSKDTFKKMKTLTQLIKKISDNYVDEVDMVDILDGAIVGMLDKLDPHSAYITSDHFDEVQEQFAGKFEGIGIEYAILDNYITVISPIPGTPSDRAGLQSGDKFIKINNKSAFKITQDEVFKKLRGPKGSKVDVTIRRAGQDELLEITLIRDEIPIVSVLASFMTDDETGYIKINRFAQTTAKEVDAAVTALEAEGMQKLILDFRNNGGGLMDQAVKIVDMFVASNDTIVYTKGRMKDSNEVYRAHFYGTHTKYPIISLINRGSASASEIVTGAFQDLDRGLVIGETSFGKGLVQRQYPLLDGSAARITIARYYTPSGRLIQRPYDVGLDEYYSNVYETNRELSDSLLSELPQFKTPKGRTVYGGGGITPDVFVKSEREFTESTREILINADRLIFNYASLLKEDIRDKYDTNESFIDSYNFDEEKKHNFFDWLLEKDIEFEAEELLENWEYLECRIQAEISSSIWGKKFWYKKMLDTDIQFQEALLHFDEARNLISQN